MLIYLTNIGLMLLWGKIFLYGRNGETNNDRNKKIFCIIVSIQWILIAGLRSDSVGADTENYGRLFNAVKNVSWSDVWTDFTNVYFRGLASKYTGDPGYLIFEKFIHLFTHDYQVFLVIVAIILFGCMGRFIYKNSKDVCFSYILFSCLFYSFYAVTGIRQTLATCLVVFLGTEFIKKRKFVKFLLITLIAFLFHKSALVFLPFYFLGNIKVDIKYVIVSLIATAVVMFGGASFLLRIANFIGYNRDSVYESNPTVYVILMVLIGIAAGLFAKSIQQKNLNAKLELSATILAACLSVLTLIDQSMMRIQQYYALFLMLSIPSIISCFSQTEQKILRACCIIVLIMYIIIVNPRYAFFWQ